MQDLLWVEDAFVCVNTYQDDVQIKHWMARAAPHSRAVIARSVPQPQVDFLR